MRQEQRTIYIAKDRKEFLDEDECRQHELVLEVVEDIKAPLGDISGLDGNGENYIQLSKAAVKEYAEALKRGIITLHPRLKEDVTRDGLHSWVVGRTLCDSDSPLAKLHERWRSIDDQSRLWGQPYYATHANGYAEAVKR